MEGASAPRKNGLATASLVCGIVGLVTSCVLIGIPIAIVGMIMGIVALVKISKSNGVLSGKDKAVTGICMGACSILLGFVFLLSILDRVREEARYAVCENNLKQIGLSMHLYAGDWNDWLPTTGIEGDSEGSLSLLFSEYQPNIKRFTCPGASDTASTAAAGPNFRLSKNEVSYHYVNGLSLITTNEGSDPCANARSLIGTLDTPIAWERSDNHNGREGRNILFLNGHVTWVPEPQFAAEIENFDYSQLERPRW